MALDEVGAGEVVSVETMNFVIQRQVNRPVCRLVLPSNRSLVTGTPTNLNFDSGSEIMDDLNWHDMSTNPSRVTPNIPGRFLVIASGSFATSGTGERRLSINKNGTTFGAYDAQPGRAGGQTYCHVSDVVEANGTTDYFEVNVFQNSGGALNMLGALDAAFSTRFIVLFQGEDT